MVLFCLFIDVFIRLFVVGRALFHFPFFPLAPAVEIVSGPTKGLVGVILGKYLLLIPSFSIRIRSCRNAHHARLAGKEGATSSLRFSSHRLALSSLHWEWREHLSLSRSVFMVLFLPQQLSFMVLVFM
uniref:Uncharacterized protein n=1 Tax=Picea glauca TaxID=3330 RepID=A0A101M4Y1_PICGL|nr:hypothetical protein ABT39_MTgene810 [Picea glauca]QHR90554.1 hypothetical protein Q903MT_gene4579 [Picea sitchensis]